jgi:hypothetical protein
MDECPITAIALPSTISFALCSAMVALPLSKYGTTSNDSPPCACICSAASFTPAYAESGSGFPTSPGLASTTAMVKVCELPVCVEGTQLAKSAVRMKISARADVVFVRLNIKPSRVNVMDFNEITEKRSHLIY